VYKKICPEKNQRETLRLQILEEGEEQPPMNRLWVTLGLWPVICAMVLAAIAYDARAASVAGVYWSTTTRSGMDKIQRADLQGGNQTDLVVSLTKPRALAIDKAGNLIFWTDPINSRIQRANLDGTNVVDILTAADGLGGPVGLAIDPVARKMYWTDWTSQKIQRADLDGNNIEDLFTGAATIVSPRSIALDPANQQMYWTDQQLGMVRRANMDGSGMIEDIISAGLFKPRAVALNPGNQKVYWSDVGSDKIERADLNGANRQDVITGVNAFGLAITGSGMLYWTENSTGKIQRSDLNGNNQEDFITGLNRPFALAVIPLPTSFGAGMTMLGCMGFVAVRRTWSTRR